jgi:AraC-like DNA-binding protein
VPRALQPHALFCTDDARTAERLATPFLGSHRLRPLPGQTRDFGAVLHGVVVGSLTVAHLHMTCAAEVQLSASAPRLLVVQPRTGGTSVRADSCERELTASEAVVVQPGSPVTLLLPDDAAHLVIGIERPALVSHLNRLLGCGLDRQLLFEPVLDLAAGSSSRWNLAVSMLLAELGEVGALLRSGIGQAQLEEFLMSSFLYGHASTFSAALTSRAQGRERQATAAAKHFIEASLSERPSLAAVAAAAGVSVRTLQTSFRAELRTTPTAYIRGRRLDRAREDLLAAGDGVTVTDVATRWGVTHLGRFAAEYRARFGESPSQTLRLRNQSH